MSMTSRVLSGGVSAHRVGTAPSPAHSTEPHGYYVIQDPKEMSDYTLCTYICSLGIHNPDYCKQCLSCAYGKEVKRRGGISPEALLAYKKRKMKKGA